MNYRLIIISMLFLVALPIIVSAENITCYSPITKAWYSSNLELCEYKLFNSTDLVLITDKFDNNNCTLANIYCSGADINKDGVVNGSDLRLLTPSLCVENCTIYPVCGDVVCELGENCSSCAIDCGVCPAPIFCGDGICQASESCSTCTSDCGTCPKTPKSSGGSGGGGGGSKATTNVTNTTNATNTSKTTGNINLNITKPQIPNNSSLIHSNSSKKESFQEAGSENLNTLDEESTNKNKGNELTGMVTGADYRSSLKTVLIVLVSLLIVVLGAVGYIVVKKKRNNSED
jgi:hypothetical protein